MTIKDGTYLAESDGAGGVQLKASVHMGKGYWVSEYGGVEVNGLDERGLKEALHLLDVEPGEYIGVWTDEETQLSYVDRSHHFLKKKTALELGKLWDQIAIWDCANNDEIRLD